MSQHFPAKGKPKKVSIVSTNNMFYKLGINTQVDEYLTHLLNVSKTFNQLIIHTMHIPKIEARLHTFSSFHYKSRCDYIPCRLIYVNASSVRAIPFKNSLCITTPYL